MMESMGLSDKTQRFNNTDGTHLGQAFGGQPESMNEFNRIEQFAKLQMAPKIKLTDLETDVKSKVNYNILPMKVHVDYFPITDASVIAMISVQFDNKDLQFRNKDGMQKSRKLEILGRVTSMTHRRVATPIRRSRRYHRHPALLMLQDLAKNQSIYAKNVPLPPGTFRLSIIAKDVVAGNVATFEQAIPVPRLDPDKLGASSLVLADLMQRVDRRSIGTGMFVLGDTKVRPRLGNAFKMSDQRLGIYFKAYNFGPDENTHRPSGNISYELVHTGSADKVFSFTEDLETEASCRKPPPARSQLKNS